jgi:hypothetical protein
VARPVAVPSPAKRIVVLDALRGVCFVVMTIDHLQIHPFYRISNPYFGPLGFFTAALGFVFLSGLVAGQVYDRVRVVAGTRAVIDRVLRRARALYITQMLMFVAVVAAIELRLPNTARWHLNLISMTPWKGIGLGAGLVYEPAYFGILPMYLLFLLFTPFILWQFGRGNVLQILAISALIWLVSALLIRLPGNPGGFDFGAFNPIGYQFVFVAGLGFGTGKLSIGRIPSGLRRRLVAVSAFVVVLCLILRVDYAFRGPGTALVDKNGFGFSTVQLGPFRLLNFAAFCLVVYSICSKIRWEDVHSAAFRWLAFVGQHSLPVFAWSILATYAMAALSSPRLSFTAGLIALAIVSASLTVPAQLRAMVSGRRRAAHRRSRRGIAAAGRGSRTRPRAVVTRPIIAATAELGGHDRLAGLTRKPS